MTVLDCQHISKSFDGVPVLRDLAFGIEKGSKTALIGVNGAGKTTWMRIVTGQMEPDAGQVVIDKNLRIGYLAQDRQGIDISGTVFEVLAEGKKDVIAIEKDLERAEAKLAGLTGDALIEASEACERLRLKYAELEGYVLVTRILCAMSTRFPGVSACAYRWAVSSSKTLISFCWMSLPTTWISVLSDGLKTIWFTCIKRLF